MSSQSSEMLLGKTECTHTHYVQGLYVNCIYLEIRETTCKSAKQTIFILFYFHATVLRCQFIFLNLSTFSMSHSSSTESRPLGFLKGCCLPYIECRQFKMQDLSMYQNIHCACAHWIHISIVHMHINTIFFMCTGSSYVQIWYLFHTHFNK